MTALPKLALALLATATLSAGDFTGGLQLGPAFPMSDMKSLTDSQLGLNLVLFGLFDLGGGHCIRPRLDGISASGHPDSIPSPAGPLQLDGDIRITATSGGLGADYLYYLDGSRARGPYLGGGLGFVSNRIEFAVGLPGVDLTKEYSSGSLAFGLYGGYQFNRRWQAELAFRSSQFDKTIAGVKFHYSLPALALSAGYTF